ncbi:MAG: hypothetical protein M0R47_12500 [Methylobacter sp.]|jgi:hypothetical protein|uniref:hypothetical protein n=1 Tax=Methylobacter sp. TaxID=2051955 RepID=UPI0025D6828A|nr:hypothetical protein [Methylobacter sp.]MCK9621344.1 hypothetical protein [Methylobacter sp.]
MRVCSYCVIVWFSLVAASLSVQAQDVRSTALPVGSGSGQIGLIMSPNEECRGPATVTPASAGRLAVLDKVNRKIVVVGGLAPEDIPLPEDLVEPADLVATTRGYVVVGTLGDVVLIDEKGSVLARKKEAHNPEAGAVRLVALAAGGLALEDLSGNRIQVSLDPAQIGDLIEPGLATAGAYTRTELTPNQATITSNVISGPLASITLTSSMRIVNVRVMWAKEGEGALVSLQESRQLPKEATFVRLISLDASGRPMSETYLGWEVFACETRRPFARLIDGRVVSLAFRGKNELALDVLSFEPMGKSTPKELDQHSDATLISNDEDVFKRLESLNGTPSVSPIALNPISRTSILLRGHAPLTIKWPLKVANFSHSNINNRCRPLTDIWHRPPRLNAMLDHEVTAIPYRWGGYFSKLEDFNTHLASGRLAGDDCTCRNANCVHPKATGMDCSGFISYAWQTGNYYTTVSLPRLEISTSVSWSDLAPGDIVNKAGSHVRLVESISPGANGRVVTVIESAANESCGGVCRRSYLESDLRQRGYKPLRRRNLTN